MFAQYILRFSFYCFFAAVLKTHVWETLAQEVDADQLVGRVMASYDMDDKEAVESHLCGKYPQHYAPFKY